MTGPLFEAGKAVVVVDPPRWVHAKYPGEGDFYIGVIGTITKMCDNADGNHRHTKPPERCYQVTFDEPLRKAALKGWRSKGTHFPECALAHRIEEPIENELIP